MSRRALAEMAPVAALCLILLLVLLPYHAYSAVLLLIQRDWGMSSGEAGVVFGATQVGYVAAVLVLMPLTDRIRTSYVLLGAAALSVVGHALFALLATDAVSGSLFRALAGAGLAGTYMPGMRLVSERFSGERRGGPIGLYVASFVGGGAVSFAGAAAMVPHFGWRGAYLAMALSGIVSLLLAGALARTERPRPHTAAASARRTLSPRSVLDNRPVLLMTAGYAAHVWELYGVRTWLAPFLATILMRSGGDLTGATTVAASITAATVVLATIGTGLGGGVSDRLGRTATAGAILALSGLCSLAVGWLIAAPFGLVLAVAVLLSATVNPDSPIYSTAVTEVAPPERLGATMAFQTTAGFTAGILSPIAFGLILDVVPGEAAWGVAFGSLGLGAMVGVVAILALRRSPESQLLAGGRR